MTTVLTSNGWDAFVYLARKVNCGYELDELEASMLSLGFSEWRFGRVVYNDAYQYLLNSGVVVD